MTRIARAGTSFLVVVVAYWFYALVVVPLVEPTARLSQAEPFEAADIWRVDEQFRRRRDQLRPLFPPGAWELVNPKILESDRAKLLFLFRDYSNKGDSGVEIWPCTLIFLPGDAGLGQAERIRRAVVLEAPEGAVLQFDGPFDLRRVQIGRPTRGVLRGRITIRSAMNSPGAEDDLHLVTRDVQLYPQYIWTPHTVEFRYGANFGRGRQLLIKLRQGTTDGGSTDFRVAGVEMIEVPHLERLHLEIESPDDLPILGGKPAGQPSQRRRVVPIDIACDGPFRFDFEQLLASFQESVSVTHHAPDGQVDRASCQWLSLQLARPREGLSPSSSPHQAGGGQPIGSSLQQIQPRKLVATGDKVTIDAPSLQLEVQGRHLEYDLATRQLLLVGSESYIRQGENRIASPRIEYQLGANGSVGEGRALGPGSLQAMLPGDAPRLFRARWGGQLQLGPYEGRKVVSLDEGAELGVSDTGSITAREIHCWLFEQQAAENDRVKPRADRLLARGNVQIASPRLRGQVDELRVWFEQAASNAGGAAAATSESPLSTAEVAAAPASSSAVAASCRFQLSAEQLDARVLLTENGTEPAELMLRGQVQFSEQATGSQRPMALTGQLVHVQDANAPNMAVTVIGSPAHVEGRGLGLTGEQINLNAETNLLWIDGAGRTDLLVDRDLEGRPAAGGTALAINWQKRMLFDGVTVRYEGQVTAGSGEHVVETNLLDVVLRKPIRFAQLGNQPEPELDQIACRGAVVLSSRASDGQGATTETRRLEVVDLQLSASSGEFRAAGPGWMKLVRMGKPNLLAPRTQQPQPVASPSVAAGVAVPVAAAKPVELVSLEIRFQHGLLGNLRSRELHFQQRVRAAYGAVPSWRAPIDPDRPELLGPETMLFSCEELSVLEMPGPGATRAVELDARGNVRVESDEFTCQAPRMSYAESKGLLVLEGDGRTPAILFRQPQLGMAASGLPADRIRFWPATRQLQVDGVKAVQIR